MVGIVVSTPMALAGCGLIPVACPAIGWSNVIVVAGPAEGITAVDLCDERGCGADGASRPDVSGIQPPSTDGIDWTFSLADMSTPDVVSLRATRADGTVIVRDGVAVQWTRVGGSEQCGGPGEARIDLGSVLSASST